MKKIIRFHAPFLASALPAQARHCSRLIENVLFAATMACMTACQNTPKTPALDMANFDLSAAPNADFYQYATGGW